MIEVVWTTKFKKDFKSSIKQNKDINKLEEIILLLQNNKTLPAKNRNHKLIGKYRGLWECHIEPDWLLIYDLREKELMLIRTGSHSDLL